MAGIGFALRRMTQADDLTGFLRAYSHAAMASAGPWLMTVIALAGVSWFVVNESTIDQLELFRTILIYNFAFSLTLTTPVTLLSTHYLSDQIYLRNVENAPGMLLGSLVVTFAMQGPLVILFYISVPDLPTALTMLCIVNYLTIAALWQVTVFLTTLKDFDLVTIAFVLGIFVSFVASITLGFPYGAFGLLAGFTIGIALIVFIVIARILAEYPYPLRHPFAFLTYLKPYWQLPLSGLFYGAAIWIDKWIMWFAPERITSAAGLPTYPYYDSGMFFAYLTIVPSLALFLIIVETSFFERYVAYYRGIQEHVGYDEIVKSQHGIVGTLTSSFRNLLILQGSVSYLAVILAPKLFEVLGIAYHHIGIFRLGVLGALFHAVLLFACIVLTYFDLRRDVLVINAVFLVLNGLLTYATLQLGFSFYGYGYFLAALISSCLAFSITAMRVAKLPYLTFIASNPSVTRSRGF